MCNPRRVRITATHELETAWERAVSRVVELSDVVASEARIRQPLDASIGESVLIALGHILAEEDSGWSRIGGDFRFELDGGYMIYHETTRELEIVARREAQITETGRASSVLRGQISDTIEAEGQSYYYDDGYGGRTEGVAQSDAQNAAQQNLARAEEEYVQAVADAAENQIEEELMQQASLDAQARFEERAAETQQTLQELARRQLNTVGLRGRQVFFQSLAQAYQDAILNYAYENMAEGIQTREDGDIIEIEFTMIA